MKNQNMTHPWALVWLFLTVAFTAEALHYIYLTFYQEGPGELLRSKISGLTFLGIPLATLCLSLLFLQRRAILRPVIVRVMVSVSIALGVGFLGVGLWDVFIAWPDPEKTLLPESLLLSLLGFVGYPLSIVFAAYRYWSHGARIAIPRTAILLFVACIGLHLLQFASSWFWPFSQALRYGAASLALFFAATNFSLLQRSVDLRP